MRLELEEFIEVHGDAHVVAYAHILVEETQKIILKVSKTKYGIKAFIPSVKVGDVWTKVVTWKDDVIGKEIEKFATQAACEKINF